MISVPAEVRTAFCFDLDGTITKAEILPCIASELGIVDEMAVLTKATMDGLVEFEPSFRLRCLLLGQMELQIIRRVIADVPLDEHILHFITGHKEDSFILTGNLDVWIQPILQRCGCRAFSSEGEYTNGKLKLKSILNKAHALRSIREDFGYERVVAIGDGANDAAMLDQADIGVAFGGVHSAAAAAIHASRYVINDGGNAVHTVENAVIAAAGLGSRLGLGKPKCMLEIGGTTLLTRMIRLLETHVSRIHVVIGYREELIIDHCSRYHPQVILVRNPEFRTTNTGHSLALGASHLSGKCLFLDGDLVINPASLCAFLEHASMTDILVGICRPNTENAVFAEAEETVEGQTVMGFTREKTTPWEWANVFVGPNTLMHGADNYVFEHLAKRLPLPGHMLELAEIDTVTDMRAAELFIQKYEL